jgi:soluble lytic murein transglycosylase-like protein
MRRLKYKQITVTLLFYFIATCCGNVEAGSLKKYVTKYKEIQVSQKQQHRLARYDHLINYFSSFSFFRPRHKVNPDFIRALILAESNARPRAKSNKGARGLTQITYGTGKEAAQELVKKNIHFRYINKRKLQALTRKDLYDPATNILLACYLIAKYNYQHKGKLDLVVSAWNAGEYSIKNKKPAQYKETLNHIGKVNGYFIYFLNKKNKGKRYAYRR